MEWVDWDFRPYNDVRPYNPENQNFLRENVFIRVWQRLNTRNALETVKDGAIMREDRWFVDNESRRYPVLKIFDGFIPTAHQTRIASNFILYLGRNSGYAFIEESKSLSKNFSAFGKGLPEAFLMQWALENKKHEERQAIANSDQYPLLRGEFLAATYEDIKTIEKVAYWCGTKEGQDFLNRAQAVLNRADDLFAPTETKKRRRQLRELSKR